MNIKTTNLLDTYKNITIDSYEKTNITEALNAKTEDQDCAAIMEISPQGYEKSMYIQEEEYVPKKCSGQTFEEKSFEAMLRIVKEGGVLTEEEEERFDKKLRQGIERSYNWALELRLPEKNEDVLKAMKNNYLMKQRTLQDLQEQIENEKLENAAKELETKNAKNAREHADRLSEARMLERTLENLNTDDDKSAEKSNLKRSSHADSEDEKEKKENMAVALEADESKDVNRHPLDKALFLAQKNENNLNELRVQKNEEMDKEKEFSKLLDEDYARTMLVFESGDFSIKERVRAYENFMDTSEEFAKGREIERNKRLFDFRAIREAKIASYVNNNIQKAQKQIEEQLQDVKEAVLKEIGQDYVTKDTKERIQDIEEQRKYDKEYNEINHEKAKKEDTELLEKEAGEEEETTFMTGKGR